MKSRIFRIILEETPRRRPTNLKRWQTLTGLTLPQQLLKGKNYPSHGGADVHLSAEDLLLNAPTANTIPMRRISDLLFTLVLFSSLLQASGALVVPQDAEWKYLPGRSEASPSDPAAWRLVLFNDASWAKGKGPFYYERQPGSATAYSGNTELADMYGNYTCVFMRKTFTMPNPDDVRELQLEALSDDGFIAWMNGAEIARFNMPGGEIPFNGVSLGALSEPVSKQTVLLRGVEMHLQPGENVLAIQAFNSSIGSSSDFVMAVTLSSAIDDQGPLVDTLIPSANALVQRLTQVEIIFNEGVTGVDASDLLVNNIPATRVTASSAAQYVFEFPQPPNGQVQLNWSPHHGILDLSSAGNPFVPSGWIYTLDPNAAPPGMLISEFMADNKKSLHDQDGDSSDWIEIWNAGGTTINLAGCALTTVRGQAQWRFPSVSLLPNRYLVVFASQKNLADATGQLHTNFKLPKEGGYLALLDPAGAVVSEFTAYPAQREDVSYGRDRGNPNYLAYFPAPTPGAANSAGGPDFAPEVKFSRAGGTFTGSFSLELSTVSPNAVIRYTLDGSLPRATSAAYTAPIQMSSSVQVRAASWVSNLLPSPPHSESYIALENNVTAFSSDLPVLLIYNFNGGAVPSGVRQFAHVSVFEPGAARTTLTAPPAVSTRAGINLRGRSTLGQSKANYRVEFWNEFDDDRDLDVLGMPADSDWVLYACNNFDPVLIHNPFMHELSRRIGRYSPRTRMVEVYVNTDGSPVSSGNYRGVYVLLEKIKQDANRVDIDKLAPEHTRVPQVTGGYLLSVDQSAPGEGQLYAGGIGVNALDPDWEEINQPQRRAQKQFITDYLDTMTDVLNGPSFADPVNGYAKYVDVSSALDHHILNVLAFNVDALRLSSYFYKPREGKLSFGPLWDFDRALGSTDGRDSNPRLWRSDRGDLGTDMFNSAPIFSNPWFSQMFQDPDFWQRWIDRWQELRRGEFALTSLLQLADSLSAQVREAQQREVARWGGFTSPRGGSYQAEVNMMKAWLSNRVDFIDTNFVAAPTLSRAGGQITAPSTLVLSGPRNATIYYTLDGTDPRFPGGTVSPNARIYTGPITLSANTRVTARARDLNHQNLTGAGGPPLSSSWSGPAAATYVVSTPPLIVTELMYHPASAPSGNTNDADNFEFIELKNRGNLPLDLPGFRFTQGIEFVFAATNAVTRLNPGEYALLVKNQAAFLSRYPDAKNIIGQYAGNLNNGGERVALEGPLQEPILDFTYSTEWYPTTDGNGFSLVVRDENAAFAQWAEQSQWRPSIALHGSPGTPELAGLIFEPVTIEHGAVMLRFRSSAGNTYSVVYRDAISSGQWIKAKDFPEAPGGTIQLFEDPDFHSRPGRFYRIVSPAMP